MAAEAVELHKLKLAELKQECLARGLEAKGNKQDLINRLQAYLEEHAEEEANEEDVLGEEIEEEEQKPAEPPIKAEEPPVKSPDVITEKKVVKITSEISQMERMQKRAERFNVPVSLESKKAARAARFGLATVSTKGLSADKPTVNMDKLKERAQRFGLNVSSLSKKTLLTQCDAGFCPEEHRAPFHSLKTLAFLILLVLAGSHGTFSLPCAWSG
ncbi:SAP domain-containing ribonucleoprotein isoform X4 [Patagioenas fasciata]|uniref:SAP domain-containing ribonucleoprotein isoform X4 n=1 Tax=Patagioenas fasciata TaxID=372321 RepID=UPI003A9A2845